MMERCPPQHDWTRNNRSSLVCALTLLLLLVSNVASIESEYHVIDGCQAAENCETSSCIITAASPSTNIKAKVLFVDCTFTSAKYITIVILPNTLQQQRPIIEVLNTTMAEKASIRIVPATPKTTTAFPGVDVVIENSTIRDGGDLFVVDTSEMTRVKTVQHVNMAVRNSVLVSNSRGNIMSVLVAEGGSVQHVNVVVGGNVTLKTEGYLVGSIVATNVVNVSLLADSSDCLGPITISAGRKIARGNVAVLSVLPPHDGDDTDTSMLSLRDVRIVIQDFKEVNNHLGLGLKTCSSQQRPSTTLLHSIARLRLEAVVGSGIALIASAALRPRHTALMYLYGHVTIQMQLTDHQWCEEDANHRITATSSGESGSSIGGVALFAFEKSWPSTTKLSLQNCTLTLQLLTPTFRRQITNAVPPSPSPSSSCKPPLHQEEEGSVGEQHTSHAITLVSRAGNRIKSSFSTVCGIILNSYAQSAGAAATFIANGHSTIAIRAFTGDSIMVEASLERGTSSVFGIALNTDSSCCSSTVEFDMGGSTNLILSSIILGTNVSMRSTTGPYAASSLFGIALNSDSSSSPTPVTFTLSDESTVVINAILRSHDVVLSSVAYAAAAASAFGVSMEGHSNDKKGSTTLKMVYKSRLRISSSIEGSNISLTARGSSNVATSIIGIALGAYSQRASSASTLLEMEASSEIDIAGVVRGDNIVIMSTVSSYDVAAVMSIALAASRSSGGDGGTAEARIDGSSSLSINVLVLGDHVHLTSDAVGHATTAVAAFVVHGGIKGTLQVQRTNEHVAIDVWVGAGDSSSINTTGSPDATAVVGLLASTSFSGLQRGNTLLAFCTDGTVNPSATTASSGSSSIDVGLSPPIEGLSFSNETVTTFSSSTAAAIATDSEQQQNDGNNSSSSAIQCYERQKLVYESILKDAGLGYNSQRGPVTPTESSARTASPTSSVSFSGQRAGSTRTVTTVLVGGVSMATQLPSTSQAPSSMTEAIVEQRQSSPTITVTAVGGKGVEDPVTSTPTTSIDTSRTIVETTAPPPPPSPRKRSVSITTSILLPDSEEAATVVLSTAGASSAVASTLGTNGGGVIVVAGSAVRMLECGLAEDDPRPAAFELPIQVPVGNDMTRYFAGAAFIHTLLLCALFVVTLALRARSVRNRLDGETSIATTNTVGAVSMAFCAAHAFFTPAILGACSTTLNNGDDHAALAVASVTTFIVVMLTTVLAVAVHLGPQHGIVAVPREQFEVDGKGNFKLEFKVILEDGSSDSSGSISSNSTSSRSAAGNSILFSGMATNDILLTLFDGCRIYEKATHRHYATIETTLYSIVAIISGARPQHHCDMAAFAIGIVAFVHLSYIILIRPFRTRLDTIFSILNAVLLLALSSAVAVIVRNNNEEINNDQSNAVKVVEACLWSISVLGFVQLGVQGYWAYHVAQRRKYLDSQTEEERSSSSSSESDDDDGLCRVPTLTSPEEITKVRKGGNPTNNCELTASTTTTIMSQPLLRLREQEEEENRPSFEDDGNPTNVAAGIGIGIDVGPARRKKKRKSDKNPLSS